MKSDSYKRRFYRDWVKAKGLYAENVSYKETDLQILSDKPLDKGYVLKRLKAYRRQLENYIAKEQKFLTSLKPIPVELRAPKIIREMAGQAQKANVGPMAAVAGAIAAFIGRNLLKRGYREVIVENGGDIFLKITQNRTLGIFAGSSRFSGKLTVLLNPKDTPLGICTSSGKVGHSLSFGSADSVTIFSKNAALADAVATATANRVNSLKDLTKAIDFARSIKRITAAVIIYRGRLASWGKIKIAAS